MNQFSQFSSKLFVLFSVMVLSGCSNGPSESDAKSAVQTSLGNCEYLSISQFDRMNGTPRGEGRYLVDIAYSIKMKPTPDIEAYASEKYLKEVESLKQQLAHAKGIQSSWKSNMEAWLKANPDSTVADYEMANQEQYYEYQKVAPVLVNGNRLVTEAPRTAKLAMQNAMQQSCPNVPRELLNNFFEGSEPVEKYADGIERNFTGKIFMVKTDNGWQEDR